MSDLLTIFVITRKDLLQEIRSKAVTVATLFFAAVVIVILAFALSSNRDLMTLAAPGVMWVALAFAGVGGAELPERTRGKRLRATFALSHS
jgi:heme exporter protein B